jgi:hypothetical protein
MAKRRKKKKKKGKSWNQIKFAFRIWFRDWTLEITTALTIMCILFIIFGALALWVIDEHGSMIPEPIDGMVMFLHGDNDQEMHYDLCLFPTGILIIMFSGWYMADSLYKRSRFNELMETESKSQFLDDLEEVEELAWKLTTRHEMMVVDKKRELGIKKKKRRRK